MKSSHRERVDNDHMTFTWLTCKLCGQKQATHLNNGGQWLLGGVVYLYYNARRKDLKILWSEKIYYKIHIIISPVGFIGLFGTFELDLQPLSAYLKPVHGLYRCLSSLWRLKTHKPKALAKVGVFVKEDFSTDHFTKLGKHVDKITIFNIIR